MKPTVRRKPQGGWSPPDRETQDILRPRPCSNDAEKGILSCILHNPTDLLPDFLQFFQHPELAFYHPAHRLLFTEMVDAYKAGQPIEYIILSQRLQDRGLMDKIGGQGALAELLDFVPTPTHYSYYRGILKDKYILRRSIDACTDGLEQAYEHQDDAQLAVQLINASVGAVVHEAMHLNKVKSWQDDMEDFDKDWTKRYNREKASASPSRWKEWNLIFGGLRPEFHILKGKTSRGKTTVALNHLATTAVTEGKPCLWFPYEMSKRSLICRLIADLGSVDSRSVFSPDVFPPSKSELNRIAEARARIAEAPIEIVKERHMDAAFVVNRCLAFAQKHGEIGLIGLDYLQRMPHPDWGGRNDNTSDRLTYNCGQCFSVQQELQCPFLLISSTNAEGGTLGSQSADYDTDIAVEVDKEKGFRVTKNRNGPTHKEWIELHFNGENIRFESKESQPTDLP